jgi:hypothetical protein
MITHEDLKKKIAELNDLTFEVGIAKEFNVDEIQALNNEYKKLVAENIPQEKRAILGIDIYQYSRFPEGKQELIPFIFNEMIIGAIHHLKSSYEVIFDKEKMEDRFLSTGDGGFFIFPTPLHALIFNCNFHMVLHLFNSHHIFPKLSRYIDGLTIRSTITYDNIFEYENNWYGSAIIKNARILSKDKLNRFLIDKETHDFFMSNFNGIETLMIRTKDEVKEIMRTVMGPDFEAFEFRNEKFRNIHVQKLEDTVAKETKLSIYNVEIQYESTILSSTDKKRETSFILTMGNSNVMNV